MARPRPSLNEMSCVRAVSTGAKVPVAGPDPPRPPGRYREHPVVETGKAAVAETRKAFVVKTREHSAAEMVVDPENLHGGVETAHRRRVCFPEASRSLPQKQPISRKSL